MRTKLLLFVLLTGVVSTYSQQLKIKVIDISNVNANLIVEFYDNESGFLKNPKIQKTYPIKGSSTTLVINDIPPGKYAVGVILDVNKNGKLDTNFLGLPSEPIGLSNYSKIRGKPKFSNSLIEIKKENNSTIIIPLK